MSCMDRRRFVEMSVGIALSGAGLGCASMVTHRVTPEDGSVRLDLDEHPSLAEPGGTVRILPDGFRDPVYVLALEGGAFTALSPVCTHRGCTVEIEGDALVCPCHGSTYDRRGNVLVGPAERALHSFVARGTGDGAVLIRLDGAG